jgi:hypothetical protein
MPSLEIAQSLLWWLGILLAVHVVAGLLAWHRHRHEHRSLPPRGLDPTDYTELHHYKDDLHPPSTRTGTRLSRADWESQYGSQYELIQKEDVAMSLFKLALESARRPIAVVIKGNPKYLEDPEIAPLARQFYAHVAELLMARGYQVHFDKGAEYTTPNVKAAVWVGHSRGIDRLRFAPASVRTLELQTLCHPLPHWTLDDIGRDPEHYRLSPVDIRRLQEL